MSARWLTALFAAVAVVLLCVFALPQTLDRRLGERIRPDGRLAWLIRGSMHLQRVALGAGTYLPIFNVISSNVPRRVYLASMALVFVAVEGGFFLKMELEDGGAAAMADYALLPDEPGERTVEYQHYADEWPEGKVFAGSATIQSQVVRDPFVRLFIPFSPRRHNPAVAERCPGIPASGAAREEAVIRCLMEIQPVTLDGRPLGDPGFHFYTDPGTGLRGLLAYVPTAGLRAGEHLLVVAPIPRAPGSDTQPPTQYIPFWVAR
jgi:hypothetical protein